MKEEILRIEHMSCNVDGTNALDDLSLQIFKKEIFCIVGLNGSGKTLFANYLAGKKTVDNGKVYFDDQKIVPCDHLDPAKLGIYHINNTTQLVPNLTVAECFYISKKKKKQNKHKYHLYSKKEALQIAQSYLDDMGINIPVSAKASSLSATEQLIISIATAYYLEAKLIVIDAVIESISTIEFESLHSIMQSIKKRGISILLLTRNMDYAYSLSDRVALIKDGSIIKVLPNTDIDPKHIMDSLLVAESMDIVQKSHTPDTEHHFLLKIPLNNSFVNIQGNKGEIIGVYDYESTLCNKLTDLLPPSSLSNPITGYIDNTPFKFNTLDKAVKQNIGFMFEYMLDYSVFNNMSLPDNLTIHIIDRLLKRFSTFISKKRLRVLLKDYGLDSFCDDNEKHHRTRLLSVNKTQKMLLSRWLIFRPAALICVKPFSHLDITIKNTTSRFFDMLALNGTTVILISSDPSVISPICDRVIFINQEEVRAVLTSEELNDIPSIINNIDELKISSKK